MPTMMACGHAANATVERTGQPCCVICHPSPKALEVAETPEGVTNTPESAEAANRLGVGRMARCSYYGKRGRINRRDTGICKSEVPSHTGLAFFGSAPNKPYDSYYCGCWGWD